MYRKLEVNGTIATEFHIENFVLRITISKVTENRLGQLDYILASQFCYISTTTQKTTLNEEVNEGVTKGVNEGVTHGCIIIITFIHNNEELKTIVQEGSQSYGRSL